MSFLPADRFEFTSYLESHAAVFRREASALSRQDYAPWPLHDAYAGGWFVFPLFYRTSLPIDLTIDFERNQRMCPETTRLLAGLPRAVGAAFSWLEPGTHIYPHIDAKDAAVVRCHLGIRAYAGARVRVGGEVGVWSEGKCLLFDGFVEHEAANEGVEPRVVLLVDFHVDPKLAAELGIRTAPASAAPSAPQGVSA